MWSPYNNLQPLRYRCCDHCSDDPSYHEDNPPDSHDVACRWGGRPCESGGDVVAVPADATGER